MKRGVGIGIALAVLIIAAILFWTLDHPSRSIPTETNEQDKTPPQTTHQVQITDTGFVPKTFTIKQGDSVTWTNKRSQASWPASAVHPSHTSYPGSGITKCGTNDEDSIFDACKGLQQGESFTFTFNEVGSWNYHDHLLPSQTGRIIVEP